MQKFWYHSPVRFYKTKEELEDMTNPQNSQFFGSKNPYPLEASVFHRFLIPNYQNEVSTTDLELWLVGGDETRIACEFGFAENKLFRITFKCNDYIQGSFEIRLSTGEILFYSNCVQFKNSEQHDGRKYVRIATKHYYNRNLFSFANSEYDWIITNLPGYCLGQFLIDSEYETDRLGENNSLIASDSYIDEVVSYQFEGDGDSNILSFIMAHAANSTFYIDGTQRTLKEKPDVDEFSMYGTMKFVNVKDKDGLNILLNEDEILSDSWTYALSDNDMSAIYVYDDNYVIQAE